MKYHTAIWRPTHEVVSPDIGRMVLFAFFFMFLASFLLFSSQFSFFWDPLHPNEMINVLRNWMAEEFEGEEEKK